MKIAGLNSVHFFFENFLNYYRRISGLNSFVEFERKNSKSVLGFFTEYRRLSRYFPAGKAYTMGIPGAFYKKSVYSL
jgi:hypothetical protein